MSAPACEGQRGTGKRSCCLQALRACVCPKAPTRATHCWVAYQGHIPPPPDARQLCLIGRTRQRGTLPQIPTPLCSHQAARQQNHTSPCPHQDCWHTRKEHPAALLWSCVGCSHLLGCLPEGVSHLLPPTPPGAPGRLTSIMQPSFWLTFCRPHPRSTPASTVLAPSPAATHVCSKRWLGCAPCQASFCVAPGLAHGCCVAWATGSQKCPLTPLGSMAQSQGLQCKCTPLPCFSHDWALALGPQEQQPSRPPTY